MVFSFDDVVAFMPQLLTGAYTTVTISLLSYVLALVLGLAFALARLSRVPPLNLVATAYIQLIRGTPLLLQLFVIYYVLPYAGLIVAPFTAGVLGLTINYSAYMAEVFRAGVQAIPRGQTEAGLSLGMSRVLLMRRIVLPQALRIVVPPIGNFFVAIFKDSALVSIISMRDLMFTGELLAASTFKSFEVFGLVAALYLVISYPAAKLVEYIERRMDIDSRPTAGKAVRV